MKCDVCGAETNINYGNGQTISCSNCYSSEEYQKFNAYLKAGQKKERGKVCPKCGAANVPGAFLCRSCGENLEGIEVAEYSEELFKTNSGGLPSLVGDTPSSAMPSSSTAPERGGAIGALRFFAWLDLVAGIIGAIVIWANFGSVEVPIFAGSTVTRVQANPVGISLGIAVLLQGIFLCAFFLVVAGAAEDVAAIRQRGQA
jgi:ribosomal protein L40E